jgi:tRNA nucleotidyltransferase/poly(A) polymerase
MIVRHPAPPEVLFPWLSEPSLAALLEVLDRDGEEARVVGGAVRNALLGEPVNEWDIATTATPDVVTKRGLAAGWKVVPTGIDHGTVTVVVDKHPYEVTTLREDVETDGRRAVVRFGRDFRADAFRRDFTINALSVTRDGTVHDYAEGFADIAARRIRFIGDADRRIAEDYLRIFRLFRFQARYAEGPLDRESLTAAIRGRAGIEILSRERIHAELLKLLVARRGPDVVEEIEGAGFLALALGGVGRLGSLHRMAAVEQSLGLEPEPIRRLAALCLYVREDAERLVERLRLSNAQARRLDLLAREGEAAGKPLSGHDLRVLLYWLKKPDTLDHILLCWSHSGDEGWRASHAEAQAMPVPVLPFGGTDVTRLGVVEGPAVGHVLARAERRWIDAGFPDAATAQAILAEEIQALK